MCRAPSTRAFIPIYGVSRDSSGIEIPEKGVDFYQIQDVPHGQVRQFRYYSKVTQAWRRAFVYKLLKLRNRARQQAASDSSSDF
jgi:hypothetical protein